MQFMKKKLFTCVICDYRCAHSSDLKKHVSVIHEKIKQFTCELCDYCSANKFHLNKHIESVHEKKKPYKCEMCDYTARNNIHKLQNWGPRSEDRYPMLYCTTFFV